ncbi:MAG: glycosyltransferase family 2 protein, partial [Armatimonadetes bacterium]|nr:glycosyltransferase family 2 protein [Armatimonadota bacterium]
RSVLDQSLAPQVIVVVDNDPSESARPVFTSLAEREPRVIYLAATACLGPSYARNAGVRAAATDRIAFLDDDDLWMPAYLERVDAAFAREDVGFVLGWMSRLFPDRVTPGKSMPPTMDVPTLFAGNPGVTGSNLVIDRALFERVGGFDETLDYSEDMDLLIRLLAAGANYGLVTERLVLHREHAEEQLSDLGNPRRLQGATRFYAKHRSKMPVGTRLRFRRNLQYTASKTATSRQSRLAHGLLALAMGDRRPVGDAYRWLRGAIG